MVMIIQPWELRRQKISGSLYVDKELLYLEEGLYMIMFWLTGLVKSEAKPIRVYAPPWA